MNTSVMRAAVVSAVTAGVLAAMSATPAGADSSCVKKIETDGMVPGPSSIGPVCVPVTVGPAADHDVTVPLLPYTYVYVQVRF
jgi:hypothetical protein